MDLRGTSAPNITTLTAYRVGARYSRRMRFLSLAILLALVLPAAAEQAAPQPEAPVIKDTFGFDYMKPKTSKCAKVSGALLAKLEKSYTCEPVDDGSTASGKPAVADCKIKKGKPSSFLLFKANADCKAERKTQLDNAAGA